ncbi:MAG: hypothetical protein GC160_00525 [Acidobacteria bacterium]|nr:hypothetical protein [Acidobacteriota bacterium]
MIRLPVGCTPYLAVVAFASLSAMLPAADVGVAEVLTLKEAGLTDDTIIAKVRQNQQPLDLSVDQMVELKQAGLSAEVIQALLNPAPAVASTTNGSKFNDGFPQEVGVYLLKENRWEFMEPELVTWRTGGMLKSIGTAGLHKGHISGVIDGRNARVQVSPPVELFIRAEEGVAASEFQLLKMDIRKDLREFRALTSGVLRAKSGSERNAVPFNPEKVGVQAYKLVLTQVDKGEFGLLAPGAVGSASMSSSGKVFAFGVE